MKRKLININYGVSEKYDNYYASSIDEEKYVVHYIPELDINEIG